MRLSTEPVITIGVEELITPWVVQPQRQVWIACRICVLGGHNAA
jgi:hypothetical protein